MKTIGNVPHGSGIYQIVCVINRKRYIGSSVDLKSRFIGHRNPLRNGIHKNSYLQNSVNKYGIENFYFEVLEVDIPKDCLIEWEQFYLDYFGSENLFNSRPFADRNDGVKYSKEISEKLSKIRKGKKRSKEVCDKISIAVRNRPKNPSTYAKISETKRNKPESYQGMIEANKKRWRSVAKFLGDVEVCVYPSVVIAAKENGINRANIHKSAKYGTPFRGFYWRKL